MDKEAWLEFIPHIDNETVERTEENDNFLRKPVDLQTPTTTDEVADFFGVVIDFFQGTFGADLGKKEKAELVAKLCDRAASKLGAPSQVSNELQLKAVQAIGQSMSIIPKQPRHSVSALTIRSILCDSFSNKELAQLDCNASNVQFGQKARATSAKHLIALLHGQVG
jgi:hypothetical protein